MLVCFLSTSLVHKCTGLILKSVWSLRMPITNIHTYISNIVFVSHHSYQNTHAHIHPHDMTPGMTFDDHSSYTLEEHKHRTRIIHARTRTPAQDLILSRFQIPNAHRISSHKYCVNELYSHTSTLTNTRTRTHMPTCPSETRATINNQ